MNIKNMINFDTLELSRYTVLIIDTSLSQIVVSVARNYSLIFYNSTDYNRNYDEVLIDNLKEILSSSNLGFLKIDFVAVDIGPGNFTGIRLGMASARAIGMILDCPVVGFTSFAALACEMFMDKDKSQVYSIIGAKRKKVYGQLFDVNRLPITKPKIFDIEELDTFSSKNTVVVTNNEEISVLKDIVFLEANAEGIMLAAYDSLYKYVLKNKKYNYTDAPNPLYISDSGAQPPSNWKKKPTLKS